MQNINDKDIIWIGKIPDKWKVLRTKNVSDISIGLVTTMTQNYVDNPEEGVPLIRNGNIRCNEIDTDGMVFLSKKFALLNINKQLRYGDLATVHTGDIGTSVVIPKEYDGCMGFATIQSKPNKNIVLPQYLSWIYNSEMFKKQCIAYCTGDGRQNLNLYNFVDLKVIVPPIKEQIKINNVIDKKIKIINEVLNDLSNQIKVLNKYKKSLIVEKVTKGLNKSLEMKDSKIHWIGKTPKHWDIYFLKHLFKMFAGGDVDEYDFSEEYSEVTPYPIYSNSLENDGLYGYMSKYRFSGNTFTVTGRGDVGKAISRNNKYYPIVRLLVCVPIFEDDTRYYSYCVNSADLLGEQTAMAQLTTQKLGMNKFPRPPIDEQKKIADYLDKKCKEIDDLIKNKRDQIEKMEEYKKSLIYEYVTGKKRVKGAEELYG